MGFLDDLWNLATQTSGSGGKYCVTIDPTTGKYTWSTSADRVPEGSTPGAALSPTERGLWQMMGENDNLSIQGWAADGEKTFANANYVCCGDWCRAQYVSDLENANKGLGETTTTYGTVHTAVEEIAQAYFGVEGVIPDLIEGIATGEAGINAEVEVESSQAVLVTAILVGIGLFVWSQSK